MGRDEWVMPLPELGLPQSFTNCTIEKKKKKQVMVNQNEFIFIFINESAFAFLNKQKNVKNA